MHFDYLPHIASTYPFQYSSEAVDLWMVERFVCVQLVHCQVAQVSLHAKPIDLSIHLR